MKMAAQGRPEARAHIPVGALVLMVIN